MTKTMVIPTKLFSRSVHAALVSPLGCGKLSRVAHVSTESTKRLSSSLLPPLPAGRPFLACVYVLHLLPAKPVDGSRDEEGEPSADTEERGAKRSDAGVHGTGGTGQRKVNGLGGSRGR